MCRYTKQSSCKSLPINKKGMELLPVYFKYVITSPMCISQNYPDVLIMTDLCLCGYTSHGHCGIMYADGRINNQASIDRLAAISVQYAVAGAHVIAPSDMMDGRIGAIKHALNVNSQTHVSVMSYAAKFASCFYGPFRDAADSHMEFGDRSLYQLPPGSRMVGLHCIQYR